jgi:hypothetical protein
MNMERAVVEGHVGKRVRVTYNVGSEDMPHELELLGCFVEFSEMRAYLSVAPRKKDIHTYDPKLAGSAALHYPSILKIEPLEGLTPASAEEAG